MAKTKKPAKKKAAKRKEEVWKCATACSWEGPKSTLKTKDFGRLGKTDVCPKCESEDVFPRDDGGWEKGAEAQARSEDHRQFMMNNFPDD